MPDNQQVTNLMQVKITPNYICGLTDGEGCFFILAKSRFALEFKISQKNKKFLERIRNFFGCGYVKSNYDQSGSWVYMVKDFKSIHTIIIPFFKRYPLIIKQEQFAKFVKVAEIIERKEHLTRDGKKKILNIKLGTSETTR